MKRIQREESWNVLRIKKIIQNKNSSTPLIHGILRTYEITSTYNIRKYNLQPEFFIFIVRRSSPQGTVTAESGPTCTLFLGLALRLGFDVITGFTVQYMGAIFHPESERVQFIDRTSQEIFCLGLKYVWWVVDGKMFDCFNKSQVPIIR